MPIETIVKSVICQVNYLEILLALLAHTVGDDPSPKILQELDWSRNKLQVLQHICIHKLKQGHVQGVFQSYGELKRVSESLEFVAL